MKYEGKTSWVMPLGPHPKLVVMLSGARLCSWRQVLLGEGKEFGELLEKVCWLCADNGVPL